MLDTWIQKGELDDPFDDFLVEEMRVKKDKAVEGLEDDFWEQRYSIKESAVPSFLEPFKDMIVRTGKYVNILRECGYPYIAIDSANTVEFDMYGIGEVAYAIGNGK